ncbi:MAG: NAD(P)H-dependent oxidoreductase [Bacteroidota bacterium]
MKKVLIIQGHPNRDSLSNRIQLAYEEGVREAGGEVRTLVIRDLDFQPILFMGYKRTEALEEDIIHAQQEVSWADHLVFIYPNWWGTYPAIFKGFIDKVLWPGFAFAYRSGRGWPEQKLKGKSARVFVTMDSSRWTYFIRQGAPGHRAMKNATLNFVGIRPVRFKTFSRIRFAEHSTIERWGRQVKKLGREMI